MLAGLVVASLIIGEVALQVVDSSGPAGVTAANTWVASVGPLAVSSGSLGATVQSIRTDSLRLGRRVLNNDLASLVLATQSTITQYGNIGLSPPSDQAGTLMNDVVTERAGAARLLASGIDLALGSGTATAATDDLLKASQMMILADLDYLRLVEVIPAKEGASTMPSSKWITDASVWSASSVGSWVAALQGSPALRTRHAISLVAVSIEPPVLRVTGLPTTTTSTSTTSTSTTSTSVASSGQSGASSTSSSTTTSTAPTTTTVPPTTTTLQTLPSGAVSVLAPTASIRVVAVVTNSGNVVERRVNITATLTLQLGRPHGSHSGKLATGGARSTKHHIGVLAPGSSRYVLMRPLRVLSGATYELTVTASAVGANGTADVASDSFVVTISG
jgi:hypothetical protein